MLHVRLVQWTRFHSRPLGIVIETAHAADLRDLKVYKTTHWHGMTGSRQQGIYESCTNVGLRTPLMGDDTELTDCADRLRFLARLPPGSHMLAERACLPPVVTSSSSSGAAARLCCGTSGMAVAACLLSGTGTRLPNPMSPGSSICCAVVCEAAWLAAAALSIATSRYSRGTGCLR